MLERNEDIELTIDALGSDGQGIGRVDGLAVFVPFALPGERIRAHVIKPAANYAVARLTDIIEPSANRVDAPCTAFGKCGGCSLMHLDYSAQLAAKTAHVRDALERIGGFRNVAVKQTIGMSDPFRYRNKAAFPFGRVDGQVTFGMYAPRSHRLIPLKDCPIQQERLVACAHAVLAWARDNTIHPYCEESGKGALRHVVARSAKNGEIMVVVVTHGALKKPEELIERLSHTDGVVSIVHNRNDKKTNAIFGDEFVTIWGKDALSENILGVEFEVSAASFMQVNTEQTEKLYSLVVNAIPSDTQRAADIYCGAGALTLLCSKKARDIIGIEYVSEAVEDAKRNASANGINNARFICADAAKELPALIKDGFKPDVIVLDPPRKGCDAAVIEALSNSGARLIIYVSCDPATLARDAKMLCERNYAIQSAQPVDMFPHTSHVETVATFRAR